MIINLFFYEPKIVCMFNFCLSVYILLLFKKKYVTWKRPQMLLSFALSWTCSYWPWIYFSSSFCTSSSWNKFCFCFFDILFYTYGRKRQFKYSSNHSITLTMFFFNPVKHNSWIHTENKWPMSYSILLDSSKNVIPVQWYLILIIPVLKIWYGRLLIINLWTLTHHHTDLCLPPLCNT